MINTNDRCYVTVAIDQRSDGIGILLPGYNNRIIVRPDSQEDGGHSRLHTALTWLLNTEVQETTD